jgi:glycosyltransferase involved in cell wall biosynthesis
MEAAACGRAIVLTDIRGCREIGTDSTEVLFVPPSDDESLAATLRMLIQNASLRERLGSAARDRALQAFDQRAVAAQSLGTYSEVLSAGRKHENHPDRASMPPCAPRPSSTSRQVVNAAEQGQS